MSVAAGLHGVALSSAHGQLYLLPYFPGLKCADMILKYKTSRILSFYARPNSFNNTDSSGLDLFGGSEG